MPPPENFAALIRSHDFLVAESEGVFAGFGFINQYGALQEAAKLSRATHTQASAGQAATAWFRSGPPLPPINAVHHSTAALAGYAAAIVAGVLCLIAARVLWWRRRSPRPAPGG